MSDRGGVWKLLMKKRIKQLRTYFALSQEQFAKKIGRTKGYISNIENGHAGMSSSTISSICSAFAVREEWLRDGIGEMFLPEREAHKVSEVSEVSEVSREEIGRRIREGKRKV